MSMSDRQCVQGDMELRKGVQPGSTGFRVISDQWYQSHRGRWDCLGGYEGMRERRCWVTNDRFWASLNEKMALISFGTVDLKALILSPLGK